MLRLITKVWASRPEACRGSAAACQAREPEEPHISTERAEQHEYVHTFLPLTCVVAIVPYLSSLILLSRMGRFPTYLPRSLSVLD